MSGASMRTRHRAGPRRRVAGRILGRLLALALLAIALLAASMAWHTWRLAASREAVAPRPGLAVDAVAAAARLGAAVRLRTIWTPDDAHAAEFTALHRHLEASFPAAHRALRREALGRHALLYTWPGSDPALPGVVLLAHQDVVPVAPGTEGDWQAPPFSGLIQGGHVWGRGAWDDKGSLMAIMEAVDALARARYVPQRTVYLAFGADEEVGGSEGAQLIAARLRQQGARIAFALDEGLLITHGMVPGVKAPVALVGLAEKGYMTLRLTARGHPGHSSMPPPRSAIGVLGEAVARLEARPMPARLDGLPRQMFTAVAPHADGAMRVLLSNLWLTAPLVERELQKTPAANAMLRTTGIATVMQAGERENVLAGSAHASVNFRLLPGDSGEQVIAHVRQVLQGLDVQIERLPQGTEASPVSSADAPGFRAIERTLRELQPDVVVAPGLLIGGTDSRHFAGLAEHVYRFSPVHAASADLARFHGTNERIGIENYVQMIQFYERLLRRSTGPQDAVR